MNLPQCQAIVLHGRDVKGNRAGLIPPRRCHRVATEGRYCGLHARNPELHDLVRDCMGTSWEQKVQVWEHRQRQVALGEAEQTVIRLSELARKQVSPQLASFLHSNRQVLAEALVGD